MQKSKIIIQPSKPIIVKGLLGCMIKLNKNQINYGDLKSRKKLVGFKEQTNRHITIVGWRAATIVEKALNKFPEPEKKKKLAKLKDILKNLKWQYVSKEIYFINQKAYFQPKILEHRKSYIQTIKMSDMNIFYRKLNVLLKTNIPTQFPHITLFSKGERPNPEYFGIPIPSKTEFKKLHPKKIHAKKL